MKILITGAGGAAAISVWKSLAETHELYMADIDPCAAGLYLVPEKQRFIIPPGDAPDFLPHLLSICQLKQIEVLIPTVDVELLPLAQHLTEFTSHGVKLPMSSAKSLELCRDKYKLLAFCEETGLCPSFFLLSEKSNPETFQFPCFAKPRLGAGSRGAMIIDDQNALQQLPKDESYLIQELLPGEEYSVDVYIRSDGCPLAAVPRLRLKIDSGIAVASQTIHHPQLSEMALKIAKQVDIRYVANIQFKANTQGDFKLLEINPRFPGTLPLTAAAGIDIPKLLIKDILHEPLSSELLPFKELMVVRYWTEHFFDLNEWKALCRT
ncbi:MULTISPECIES: ATP-grasp domain-containing protein [Legionella]|uniref:Carbamoyl-phosphate synthase large chain n=1 Tax=Legionella drozanskii LLAP-1 TaxID=1212489 RepID=A0A0W0TBI8_9GAMM|nr:MULTISPECIES: ATP-grasp domain-containing protein [Legionella]KTC92938.1 Carbamoyl-phosphate synthase large chain [Legionella drozanskii LLAP-1]PJE13120.1 MAG: biotin carboxylase [Legionella sp.]